MGKKLIFSKEMIVNSAFELFKENGIDSITARGVAKYLNSSPVPIYSSIGSMDELKKILIHKAKELLLITYKETILVLSFVILLWEL